MKSKFLLTLLVLPLLLTSCSGGDSKDSSGGESGGQAASVDPEEADAYEKSLDSWSKSGHLYMHYLRPGAKESDYDNWGIWLWQNAPQDLEGTLWGAVNDACKATVPNLASTTRMTDIGGSGKSVDDFGVVYDIDLTRTDLKGGKSGASVSYEGATKIGFLVVDLTSMDGTKHWTSDGGKNLYIEDFQSHWRSSGAMHIFLVQGDCSNFRFTASGEVEVNPTIADKEGKYRSVETKITDKYPVNGNSPIKTSTEFKTRGVGYQVFVASFRDSDGNGMGDIQGIIDSLDYLKTDLNVDTLWLTPVQKCESYHGYDTVDYYHIDDRFGGDAKYEELLTKAHEKGIKVLMDLVLNHTSKNNIWYTLSQKASVSKDEATGNEVNWRNIYHWKFKGDKVLYYKNGSYQSINVQDHPDWYKDGESDYYYYGKFGSGMPELNYDNQETRNLVINLAKYWLKKGVDGFRLDAVKHIYMKDEISTNASGDIIVDDIGTKNYYDEQLKKRVSKDFDYSSDVTRNIEFWKEFSGDIKKDYPKCFLVGENFDGYGARIAPYYQALDSQFDFSNFFHIDEWVYQRKDSKDPATYSEQQIADSYAMYKSNSNDSSIWANGKKVFDGNYPTGHRSDFINGAFTSNHDTLRAINHVNPGSTKKVGSYTTSKVTGTAEEIGKAKVAAAMTLLNSGLSWIYYGDELGMSSNTDKHYSLYGNENNEDLWYRQPFKWKTTSIIPNYSFNTYKVEWDDYNKTKVKDMETQKTTDGSMLKYYMGLTKIKAVLKSSNTYTSVAGSGNVAMWKVGSYTVCVNTGSTNASVPGGSNNMVVYASSGYSTSYTGTLPGYSVLVKK